MATRVYHNNLYSPVWSAHQNIEHIALCELDKFPFPWLGVAPIFDLIVPKNYTSWNFKKCVLIISTFFPNQYHFLQRTRFLMRVQIPANWWHPTLWLVLKKPTASKVAHPLPTLAEVKWNPKFLLFRIFVWN